jgi:hypothetical protein
LVKKFWEKYFKELGIISRSTRPSSDGSAPGVLNPSDPDFPDGTADDSGVLAASTGRREGLPALIGPSAGHEGDSIIGRGKFSAIAASGSSLLSAELPVDALPELSAAMTPDAFASLSLEVKLQLLHMKYTSAPPNTLAAMTSVGAGTSLPPQIGLAALQLPTGKPAGHDILLAASNNLFVANAIPTTTTPAAAAAATIPASAAGGDPTAAAATAEAASAPGAGAGAGAGAGHGP